nr:hypothetical protein [uncultured Rhodopila sp.]
MHSIEPEEIPNEVTALFAGSAISFDLSPGATFAELADRLDNLGDRHPGTPKAVYLKLAWPGTATCLETLLLSENERNF